MLVNLFDNTFKGFPRDHRKTRWNATICDTGETLEYYDIHDYILTATIHHKQTAIIEPNFYYSLAPQDKWIVYPWEQKDSQTTADYATKGK